MPLKSRSALTNVEVDFLRMWIENGAFFEKLFDEQNPDEKEKYLVSVYLSISTLQKSRDELTEVTEIDE